MSAYNLLNDKELASLLKEGDHAAFSEIYQRYKWVLYLHAVKRIGDREQAKDTIQELFTTLWQRHAELDLHGHLSGYLYSSVRNRVINLISRQQVAADYVEKLAQNFDRTTDVTDHRIRTKNLQEIIDREIDALPEKMREVFLLSRKEHLSHAEIAEKLGISELTVKRQVSNALKTLRVKLGLFTWLAMLIKFL